MSEIMEKNWIEFPNLGLRFNIDPVAFRIGGVEIHWKWIFAFLAIALCVFLMLRETRKKGLNLKRTLIVSASAGIFGLIGARMLAAALAEMLYRYYMAQSYVEDKYYFSKDFFRLIINLRDGQITIFGGFILGVSATAVLCAVINKAQRKKDYRFADYADCAALALPLSQAVFAVGHFFSQTHTGRQKDGLFSVTGSIITDRALWLRDDNINNGGAAIGPNAEWKFDILGNSFPVSANFLIEIFGCVAVFLLLKTLYSKRLFRGEGFMWYLGLYSIVRAAAEWDMTESLMLFHVNINLFLSIITFAAMTVLVFIFRSGVKSGKMKNLSMYVDVFTNDGFENTEFWQREYTKPSDAIPKKSKEEQTDEDYLDELINSVKDPDKLEINQKKDSGKEPES